MPDRPKRLFVSASAKEKAFSDAFINILSNAFEGSLTFSSSAMDLGAGHEWKTWIKSNLQDCDAGLFLITPTYSQSPWPSAEFTAFWLQNKPIYVLLAGDIGPSDLFGPMRDDYQATHLRDVEQLKRFFANLAEFSGKARTPFEFAELLSFKCLEAYEESQAERFATDQDADPSVLMPDSSTYQLRHELYSASWQLSRNLDSDTLKGVCTREERIVCQSGVTHYTTIVVAQAANIVPFAQENGFHVELVDSEYEGGRVSVEHVKYATGEDYSFRVQFTPPLRKRSHAAFRVRFEVPQMKAATAEQMREYLFEAEPDVELRNYESFVVQVRDPTDRFVYEAFFDDDCQIQPEQPEVSWRRAPIAREQAELLDGAFTCLATEDGGWHMRLEREDPTVDTRYTLRWKLPRRRDLATS